MAQPAWRVSSSSKTRDAKRVTTLIYHAKAEIDGKRYPALIQPVAGGKERIVGRDVSNHLRVLFEGPPRR
jgi:hypothetical protein